MGLWVTSGTVAVTAGSPTVTGTGTAWDKNTVIPGYMFVGPDGNSYEVQQLASSTVLILTKPYAGATAAGQSYAIIQTAFAAQLDLLSKLQAIITMLSTDVNVSGRIAIGAPSIATGKLAVKSDSVSFENAGSVLLRIAKAALSDTGFLQFETALAAKVKMGLDANDHWTLSRVNGAAVELALKISADRNVEVSRGLKLMPGAAPDNLADGMIWQNMSGEIMIRVGGLSIPITSAGTVVTTAAFGALTGAPGDNAALNALFAGKQAASATLTTLSSATAAGLALMDDADAAAQRVTLGLGTAATQPATAFEPAGAVAGAIASHNALGDPHGQYLLETERGVSVPDLVSGKVPSAQLPSFVDDVLEFANLAAFPVTGESGKIYVDLSTNKTHRWSGSAYVEISASPGSTDVVVEGATNKYFTEARVRAALLTGISFASAAAVVATDSVLVAFGKLQQQINTHTHTDATSTVAGFMSAADKVRSNDFYDTQQFGRTTPAVGTAWLTTVRVIPDEMVSPADGYLSSFSLYVSSPGVLNVQIVEQFNDGVEKAKVLHSANFATAGGLVTVQPNLPWLAGKKVAFSHSGQPHYGGSAADPGVWYSDPNPITTLAAGTPLVQSGALVMQAKAIWVGSVRGAIDTGTQTAATNQPLVSAMALGLGYDVSGFKMVENNSNSEQRVFRIVQYKGSTAYTFAGVFLNAGRKFNIFSNTKFAIDVIVDSSSGTAVAGPTNPTQSITAENLGCGLTRVTVVATTSAGDSGANLQIRLVPFGSSPGAYLGDNVSGGWVKSLSLVGAGFLDNLICTDVSIAEWTRTGLSSVFAGNMPIVPLISFGDRIRVGSHPLTGRKVSMLGTSLVSLNIMPPQFASVTGCILQNLGVSGGALGLDARGSPHSGSGAITAQFSSINADAEVIFLDMLLNDVAASDVPLGVVTDTTTATYYGALANFFRWCETNRPNAKTVVVIQTSVSETYTPSDYRHGVANANGNFLEDFQNATRRVCRYYGRPYIDPNEYGIGFLDSGEDASDGLHWDASGAVRISKIYAEKTRELCNFGSL